MNTDRKHYSRKIITCKALDIDTATKSVKIAIGETETVDHDGDLIIPTAAIKTMKERGPAGTNEIWHLLDHTPKSFSALSKFSEMGMYGKYIGGVSKYKDSFAWREVAWPLYEAGDFTQHSIGFQVVDEKRLKDYNEIREIKLFEGSAVLWGANPQTPMLEITKALGFDPAKDDIIHRIERLSKCISTGKYEDETHKELMVIALQQIKQDVSDIVKSTEPDMTECPHCKAQTSNVESGMGYIKCEKCNQTFSSQKSTSPDEIKDAAKLLDTIKQFTNSLKK